MTFFQSHPPSLKIFLPPSFQHIALSLLCRSIVEKNGCVVALSRMELNAYLNSTVSEYLWRLFALSLSNASISTGKTPLSSFRISH